MTSECNPYWFFRTAHKIRESLRTWSFAAVIVCALAGGGIKVAAQTEAPPFDYRPRGSLPTNGRIILVASGTPAFDITTIGRDSPRLIAEGDTVPLEADRLSGNLTGFERELILTPQRPLIPGREYRLSTRKNIPALEELRWNTGMEADTTPPVWNGQAAYIGGCDRDQESHYAYIALPFQDEDADQLAIEVELTAPDSTAEGEKTLRTIIFPRREIIEQFNGAILVSDQVILKLDYSPEGQRVSVPDHMILPIGKGVYGGAISFEAGKTYRLKMRGIDAAGNISQTEVSGRIRIPADSSRITSPPPSPGGSQTESENRPQSPPPHQALIPVFDNTD